MSSTFATTPAASHPSPPKRPLSGGLHPVVIAECTFGVLFSIASMVLAFALAYNNNHDNQEKISMNVLNIRSWADVRAFLYVLLPVVSALLVGHGVFTSVQANLWTGLATAVLGPVVAAFFARTVSTFRTAFYAVLAAVQGLVIYGYGIASEADFSSWMPLVVAIVGLTAGGVAAANTDTTNSLTGE